jgi:glycosyltransferase involved in cell wall biosynthesis
MEKNKIRVVWLCHFSNEEIKEYFNIREINEFAPWINNLIQLFKHNPSVELHIVAPNVFTNKKKEFVIDGIHYHFYQRIPIIGTNSLLKKAYTFLKVEQITDFCWIKYAIRKIITKIHPDIIHLHGAENPYYSAGILPLINKFPVITTIQGFICNNTVTNYNVKYRIRLEKEIIEQCRHFGTRTDDMSQLVVKINPNAVLHHHGYAIAIPSVVKENIGKNEPIDCLFFARVCKDKGIEDLLEAISKIKKTVPSISLAVIGKADKKYLSELNVLCDKLKIESNVNFVGFLPKQADIYEYALQAKLCVLPTHHDIISGTIIESMFLKLPVVAYAVGGIPELNKMEETVRLVDKGNIEDLAQQITFLLNNKEERKILAEKAYSLAQKRFNKNDLIENDILKAYNLVISDLKKR